MPWQDRNLKDTCRVLCQNLLRMMPGLTSTPSICQTRQEVALKSSPDRTDIAGCRTGFTGPLWEPCRQPGRLSSQGYQV